MTSKGALALLEARCRYFAQDNMELEETYEAREAIEKDLEVLEILKRHLYVHQTNAKDLFELRAIFDLETYDEEERQENQKVKEWLKNDK